MIFRGKIRSNITISFHGSICFDHISRTGIKTRVDIVGIIRFIFVFMPPTNNPTMSSQVDLSVLPNIFNFELEII